MTEVIHIKDMLPGDVYIGRAGKGNDGYFGNPFFMSRESERAVVIEKYREYFNLKISIDGEFYTRIHALKGKRLVCFCAPKACHGHVIKEYLDNLEE